MVRPVSIPENLKEHKKISQKTVSLPDSLWFTIEKLKKQFHEPSRSALIRRIIVEWLKEKGLINNLG
ncbi:MAG: ribbon-helix-helix protein, CopG family [Candidatus Bathyarchaeota archaeon]|nr:ribbon-helix-helix protein, CopG family [Candidatus Bathyarchaeota archaeon]